VVRLLAAAGDRVQAGDLLAEISSPEFLEAQRAFLDATSADQLARSVLERDRQLVTEGIASRRRLEQTETEAAVAAAAVAEHRQMLRIGGLDTVAIERLERKRELLSLLPVRAPLDGVVLALSAQVGAGVEATEALFRIGDLSTLWLEVHVPQQQLRAVAEGMSVSIEPDDRRIGRVLSIGGAVDAQTQQVSVRVLVDVAGHGLRPGQFVAARIIGAPPAETEAGVWAVPLASVVQVGAGRYVFVRTAQGFSVEPVQQMGTSGENVLVTGALDDRTAVADRGVSALKALWGGPVSEAP
jgi:RND family efflux transporter MFP subunit